MIKRIYKTEEECAHCFVEECITKIPDWYFTQWPDFPERFEFIGIDEETDEIGHVPPPMWSTWFRLDEFLDVRWAEEHEAEVAGLGFTLIYLDGDLFALGIDGAGYNFYEHHWTPLYRARGLNWHDEG